MRAKGERMAQKKNSLVANINRRKKAGTSRPKSRSKVSSKSYKNMERGWGKTARKKTATKKTAAKKTARKSPARKRASRKSR
ncbi:MULTISPECIES: excinuclease ABC subunit A [unclassified Corallococcus]|uniref:excinuclease ABC subunit A n=1 Tax=unclassified Corallococcus TaxID=2685029 RepID=UPI001A8EE592|nr:MULTISPECIES: excinuclease ABC subunit A [unclassified Corallococcus]MBN9688125.1 excinuclease ABC subunit A [Corallococcus sp. NCSPR001]WAS88065.1 excinuclease ABC subunit A [Corallococcus sp. NCRR]